MQASFSIGASSRIARSAVKRVIARLRTTVLPQDCALCRAPSAASFVCGACARDLPRLPTICPVCAMPSPRGERCGACLREPPAYRATIAALPYTYPIDRVMQSLKYHARLPAAAWIAGQLSTAIEAHSLAAGDERPLAVPIPLSSERLRERGFNQAWEITRRLAHGLADAADPHAMVRVRDTQPQAALPLGDRRRNLRGAFRASSAVMGRHVVLVDDVMTSGATLDAAASAALAAGASSVTCWVAARAYPRAR